mgnify:CR=1 FL=1
MLSTLEVNGARLSNPPWSGIDQFSQSWQRLLILYEMFQHRATGASSISSMTNYPEQPAQTPGPPQGPPAFPNGAPYQAPPLSRGPMGKIRNPFLVWLFSGLTFGIYYLYWHYSINRELAEYDNRIEVVPVMAMLAQLIPIVGYVSVWNTGTRVRSAQAFSGRFETCSGALGFLLGFIILGNTFYYQSELNNLWRSQQA